MYIFWQNNGLRTKANTSPSQGRNLDVELRATIERELISLQSDTKRPDTAAKRYNDTGQGILPYISTRALRVPSVQQRPDGRQQRRDAAIRS